MQLYLIIALLVALVAVIFAVQNMAVVSITFFAWNISVSLAIALLVALGAGVLITLLVSIPGRVKGGLDSASNKKKFSNLEAERANLQSKITALTAERDHSAAALAESKIEISNLEVELANMAAALQGTASEPEVKALPAETHPETGPTAEI